MTNNAPLVFAAILVFFISNGLFASGQGDEPWQRQQSGVSASLRGLCVVDENVVWASGSDGTVVRTIDGGSKWKNVSVKSAGKLDFRDIQAFDSDRAVIISAGQPARVYRTEDGGKSWKLCFEHPDEKSFFDAISFFDAKHGIAMSDPIDGRVLLIETKDGGTTWGELPPDTRPKAEKGEAGFAASGTNMRVVREKVFIALGGAEKNQQRNSSRIVFSNNRGKSWNAVSVPIARNESSGIFSMHFIDDKRGVVVGGNYLKPEIASGNIAVTNDGGETWKVPDGTPPRGYRSCVAHFKSDQKVTLVCVGPGGTDVSIDDGNNWSATSDTGFHTVAFTPDGKFGWASGADGRIARWK